MTIFQPCIGCIERLNCDIKKRAIRALRGQPVTAARIRCALPFTKHFPPGSRVLVKVWDHDDDYDLDNGVPAKWVSSTVVGPSSKKRGRLPLNLDAPVSYGDQTKHEFVSAWPKDVKPLDEPLRAVCHQHGRALVKDVCGQCENEEMRDQSRWP